MSRRGFVKLLITGAVLLFGGLWLWLKRWLELGAVGQTAANSPSPPTASQPSASGPAAAREKGNLLLSLFLFSDMHITVDEPNISNKLRLALDDVTSMDGNTDAIVFGGDLTDFAREADYKLLRSILNDYRLPPLYGNMGNHDYYGIWLNANGQFSTETVPNGKTDEQSRRRFQEFMGVDKPYHDVWINGVHLILLSQEAYVQEKPDVGEGAWYSDAQLEWLKQALEPHKNGKPALIFIHQPLPAPGSDGGTHRLIRANEFRAILKPYRNVFVFSGHTHQNLNTGTHYSKETFHWFMNASVGKTRGGAGGANTLAQGMCIQVYEGAIAVKGREFSTRTWIPAAQWEIGLEA